MAEYQAPLADMHFLLRELIDFSAVGQLSGFEDSSLELAQAVLEHADKFAGEVLSPLNHPGDIEGARWKDGGVVTPDGWRQAYARFIADGWNAMSCPGEWGGQNQPRVLAAFCEEMWHASNMAFALCPMLTRSAVDAIAESGSSRLKRNYLHKLVAGEWTGTMDLTEPQAGSDLAAVRTRAIPRNDGRYSLEGQKIFITYGEHDLADNIVHLVLARTPQAPEGVKGISLFVVPKFLLNEDGSPGARNDVYCLSIERKLGIHASPTCVLAFGSRGTAIGELVGDENRGLEYMFIMMNAARLAVGIQGIGISERAYQSALSFARQRIQGSESGRPDRERVALIRHPDVRRMLMMMKSQIEAMRALTSVVAVSVDFARLHPQAAERARHQAYVDLMIPVVKGWCTETSVEIASLGIQVHGGMGFIEETGVAQYLRDARITPIYEGTTGIQANDLIGRKLTRDGGQAASAMIANMRAIERSLTETPALQSVVTEFSSAVDALERVFEFQCAQFTKDRRMALVGAVPLIKLFGLVAGGAELLRSGLVAHRRRATLGSRAADGPFYEAKVDTARFYSQHVLSQAPGLAHAIIYGAAGALVESVF